MLHLSDHKPQVTETQQLLPLSNYGIKCMSMGFLAEKVRPSPFAHSLLFVGPQPQPVQDSPVIWRGPMVMGALEQVLPMGSS
jgi:ATP-binding protein involved in chromosome partitioning